MPYRQPVFLFFALLLAVAQPTAWAQTVPPMLPYTGTIAVSGTPAFNGDGHFKFAIVNNECQTSPFTGCASSWSNDLSKTDGSEPTTAVTIPVTNGVFAAKLGDQKLSMQPIPATVFDDETTFLRVWFSDNGTTFEQLSPDRQLVSVPYAYQAEKANKATDSEMIGGKTIGDLGGGTVTSVGSGAGLTGGPITGSGELRVAPNDIDTTMVTDGTILFQDLNQNGCSNGQVPKWSGTAWACGTDANSGGIVTGVTASIPLFSTGGTTPNISFTGNLGDSQVADSISINNGRLWAPIDAGNVGIGTTNPQATYGTNLTVSGTASAGLELQGSAPTTNEVMGGLDFHNGSSRQVALQGFNDGGTTTSGFKIYTSNAGLVNTPAMTIKGNGNVGIRTPSPQYGLDVSGAARATDGIRIPLYSAEQTGAYTLTCPGGGLIPITGLSLTFTVNTPSTLDISAMQLVNNNVAGGATYTGIYVDGMGFNCTGGVCISGVRNPVTGPVVQWAPTSNQGVVNVGVGSHTVQIRMSCDGTSATGTSNNGSLVVRVYPQ